MTDFPGARLAGILALGAAIGSFLYAVPAQSQATPPRLASATQLVVVVTPGWTATSGTLRRYVRTTINKPWKAESVAVPVVIGRTGLAWGDSTLASAPGQPVKREGDGKSPAGAFPLDTAFGFAPTADAASMGLPYTALQPGSDCVDDVRSQYYNTVVDRAAVPSVDWSSAEHMRQISVYRIGVIVGYNAAPPARGRGSCIFLHIWSGATSVTAGCTALDEHALASVIGWLDATRRPVLVQLTAAEYRRRRAGWHLPPL